LEALRVSEKFNMSIEEARNMPWISIKKELLSGTIFMGKVVTIRDMM